MVRWSAELQPSAWQNRLTLLVYISVLAGLCWQVPHGWLIIIISLALFAEYGYGQWRRYQYQPRSLLRLYADGRCFWQGEYWYCQQAAWLSRYWLLIYLRSMNPVVARRTVIVYQDSLPSNLWRDLRRFLLWEHAALFKH